MGVSRNRGRLLVNESRLGSPYLGKLRYHTCPKFLNRHPECVITICSTARPRSLPLITTSHPWKTTAEAIYVSPHMTTATIATSAATATSAILAKSTDNVIIIVTVVMVRNTTTVTIITITSFVTVISIILLLLLLYPECCSAAVDIFYL